MKEKKKLPNRVYVYIYQDGDEEFLSVEETAEGCADKGNKKLVGVYGLTGKISISLEVKEELYIENA